MFWACNGHRVSILGPKCAYHGAKCVWAASSFLEKKDGVEEGRGNKKKKFYILGYLLANLGIFFHEKSYFSCWKLAKGFMLLTKKTQKFAKLKPNLRVTTIRWSLIISCKSLELILSFTKGHPIVWPNLGYTQRLVHGKGIAWWSRAQISTRWFRSTDVSRSLRRQTNPGKLR